MKRDDPEAMAEYCRRYNASPKARESRKLYASTPQGRAVQRKARARYNRANKSIIQAASRARKNQMLQRADKVKMDSGCADCGYRGHPAALDFDHIDPRSKTASVSQLIQNASWSAVEIEIAKCEIVCANCHRIRTVLRRHGRTIGTVIMRSYPSLFDEEVV